jgi:hypothetical protein
MIFSENRYTLFRTMLQFPKPFCALDGLVPGALGYRRRNSEKPVD